ncbi:uncharacterized protein NPIL_520251 [Nephila pilipes]|uniref:OTU domain-containing protein n=1 Tax=Nephila pilipes TaxID=299642 RepID=A0A8X6NCL9_NEPPI|nr:uncharacterized protein NPIL_520251 [Nephila pilipes]
MYVVPPVLQDLSSWPSGKSIKVWEVSTPPDNSISWSIVLSYVIASSRNPKWVKDLLGDEREIAELMRKKNLGTNALKFNSIKEQITKFNPFKNEHSFFFNKDVIKIVRLFDLKLNRYANTMRKNSSDWNDNLKLTAAAKMLDCYLEMYEMDSSGNKVNVTIYSPLQPMDSKEKIILFQHTAVPKKLKSRITSTQDEKIINMFAFGMSLEHVVPLRRDALGHILKRAKLPSRCIQEIQHSFNYRDNFLVFLLTKNSLHEIIPSLFVSPYIAWKLEAAGFNMDPCLPGPKQLSAFYYCLNLDSTLVLHVLYNYASNNFEQSDKTTRNPDQEIQRTLKKIKNTLLKDCSVSNSFSIETKGENVAFKTFEDILCFNEYQRLVVDEILDLEDHSSHQLHCDARNVQFIKKILDTYYNYFHHPKETPTEDKYGKFQNFIEFSEYYENLDNFTCLLFFDKCLSLPKSTANFTNTVHNLFLTIFGYNLFPKCVHGAYCLKCELSAQHSTLRFIPFTFRSKFLESSKVLLEELKVISEKNAIPTSRKSTSSSKDPKSNIEKITASLKDIPEIKDYYLISRLRRYLVFAIEAPLSDGDMKGVLTIERALQVIGETLNTSETSCIIGHLFCSCFPKNVLPDFFKIRNHCLSKYRPNTMQGKLTLEKDLVKFDRLQKVMEEVYRIIQPICGSQHFRVQNFMINRCLRESKSVNAVFSQNMEKEHCGVTRLMYKNYSRYKSKFKLLSNNLLDYVESNAGETKCLKNGKIGQLETLKFLFTYFANYCDGEIRNELLVTLNNLSGLSGEFERKVTEGKPEEINITPTEIQIMNEIISKLRALTDSIFIDTIKEPNINFDFSDVTGFFNDVVNFHWFSDEEMSTIKNKISEYLKQSCEVKKDLEYRLGEGSLPTAEETRKLVEMLITSEKNRKNLLDNLVTSKKQALNWLQKVKEKKVPEDLNDLIKFVETEEGNNLLLKIDFQSDLKKKILQFMNRKIEILLNRISHIKSILIEDDTEISQLWDWGKSEGMKAHLRYLMAQRYWRERDVRASLEMLLFDCMNILKSRESLHHLWTKATHLFTGANLRDFLSHGNTVFETVGGILDKEDLPSHLIEKMLELIEDGETLKNSEVDEEKDRSRGMERLSTATAIEAKESLKFYIWNAGPHRHIFKN